MLPVLLDVIGWKDGQEEGKRKEGFERVQLGGKVEAGERDM